jgi:predicted ATPase
LVTYILEIKCTEKNKPFVSSEVLKYRRGSKGKPWHFLDFKNGKGNAIVEENTTATKENEAEREEQTLESPDILALKGLGQFQKFKTVSEFRKVIENWCCFDFHIEDARPAHEAGYAEHLSSRGDNLALVTKYIYENHRDVFNAILDKMKKRVPGVTHIEAEENYDRVVLKFQDGAFSKSFTAKHVSDGTLKMFAYLLLLNDPNPHPFLCIEESENQLYPSLMTGLAEEFQDYTKDNGQVFVTTHSPDLLNAVDLDSVFYLVKRNGVTTIKRASEDSTIKALFQAGDPLGSLWKQKLLEGVDP